MSINVPKRVFIIPYRDREEEKKHFIANMQRYLSGENDWEMYFAHQCDTRPFNRGAMKNIGFLAIKDKYPHHYKDITFIFHDVDNYPRHLGSIPYTTTNGVVSHFYGFTYTLGGIFAIKGRDFESAKGFPNFWGWGFEDNVIQDRCIRLGFTIDRTCFFPFNDCENIIHKSDTMVRTYSREEGFGYKRGNVDDITHLKNCSWNFDGDLINITHFSSPIQFENLHFRIHDIKKHGSRVKVGRIRGRPMKF